MTLCFLHRCICNYQAWLPFYGANSSDRTSSSCLFRFEHLEVIFIGSYTKSLQSFHLFKKMFFYGEGRGFPRRNHLEDTFTEPSQKTFFKMVKSVVKDKRNLTEIHGVSLTHWLNTYFYTVVLCSHFRLFHYIINQWYLLYTISHWEVFKRIFLISENVYKSRLHSYMN